MKLFRKPCVSVSDVVNSTANDKEFALARKKDLGLNESEYEYVRREYGYDYVPPSQYVPSQSMDSSDVSQSDAVDEEYKATPVKIMEPPSDLSGSMYDGDVAFRGHPRRGTTNRRIHAGSNRKTNTRNNISHLDRRSEANPYRPSSPSEEEAKEFFHRPSRQHHHQEHRHLQRHQRVTRKHQSAKQYQIREPQHYEQLHRYRETRTPERRPVEEGFGAPRSNVHYRASDAVASADRGDDQVYQTRSTSRRVQQEDPVDDDDLAISPVHTAFSYNSNDSAQILIEEQSKGSRYKSVPSKEGAPRRDGLYRRFIDKSRGVEEDDWGGDATDADEKCFNKAKNMNLEENDARSSALQQSSDHDEPARRRNTSKLDEFIKPRYDRYEERNDLSSAKQGRDDDECSGQVSRNQNQKSSGRRSMNPPPRETEAPPQSRSPKILRHAREGQKPIRDFAWERDEYERVESEQTEGRRRPRDPASFYSTPSGRVASDYAFSESGREPPPRVPPGKKKGSMGVLGRIRDSVRGKKEPSKVPVMEENVHFVDGHELSAGRRSDRRIQNKPSGLFEQIQPSVRSDVSFENRRGPKEYREAGETISQPHHVSRPRGNRPDKREGQNHDHRPIHPRHSRRSTERPPVFYDKVRQRSQLDESDCGEYYYYDPRIHEEAYWEASSVEYSDYLPENNLPTMLGHSAPVLPFESFRAQTPTLRANPDHRRRHLPVAQTMSRHYTNGYHNPHAQLKDTKFKTIGTDSRLTTTPPAKALSGPKKPSHLNVAKQDAMYPTRMGLKLGCM
jgi:hypothetical protein